ncbi:hypothetical protein [Marivita sp. XM-24bin2]|uniref:hypothetical protein n=1 Tax=Marivita sp. XM-24bin2 TaxID=2133951 RepID=UPI000D79E6B3|nr:hypothetical protein [Marivita sp. XM-24bin2]PWL36358.1 MAG: hypothetical protein DCO97_03890 [Marivita sp. XM-24bin2]
MKMKQRGLHPVIIFTIATPMILWLAGRGVIVVRSDDLSGREVVARDDGTLIIGPCSCASIPDLLHALRLGAALYRWKRLPCQTRSVLRAEAERVRLEDARAQFFGFSDAEIIISRTLARAPAKTQTAQQAMNRFALPVLLRWGVPIGPVFMMTILPVQVVLSVLRHAVREK